jgi:hypothetical protein
MTAFGRILPKTSVISTEPVPKGRSERRNLDANTVNVRPLARPLGRARGDNLRFVTNAKILYEDYPLLFNEQVCRKYENLPIDLRL